ncbi:MAG: response regulator [Planctomycetota bacterium]|jgi:excisionase family DNA binding protein
MPNQKDVLTTGEVAKICNVAPRTVSKWFDSGQLNGYRIPGSKDRRIPVSSLIRFMKQHQIPMDGLQSDQTRVLIVDAETEVVETLSGVLNDQANYDVRTVSTGFRAGLECEKFRPHVILLDLHLTDIDAHDVKDNIRENPDLQMSKVVALSSRLTDGQANQLLNNGFDGFVRKPFNIKQVVEAIEDAVSIVY